MSDADSRHSDQGAGQSKVISMNPGELAVSRSDDGQYLLLFAGQKLRAIYGAMGAIRNMPSSPTPRWKSPWGTADGLPSMNCSTWRLGNEASLSCHYSMT